MAAFDLAGKVAAVTGGASGIGLALARRLADEGALVGIADVNGPRLADVARTLPDALTVQADVADTEQADAFAATIVERFGAVQIVCANAGVIGPAGPRLWEVPDEAWRHVVDVNLLGTVNTLRSFVPHLVEQQPGHVCITSSMAGVTSSATMPAYYATKHALVSIAETLRLQFERDRIDIGVSALLPARVTTHLDESLTGALDPSNGVPEFNPREIAPAEVADRFVDAIQARELYVFTHPEAVDRVRARVEPLLDAFEAIGARPTGTAR